jgi:hypothetical protein
LHVLVKLQYTAAAACFRDKDFVAVMDRRKGKGNAMEMRLCAPLW